MTNDLGDLKIAMQSATPAPDAARKAANLEMAQLNFGTFHAKSTPARRPLWSRMGFGGGFAALATTSAVVLGGVFLAPQPSQSPTMGSPVSDLAIAELSLPASESIAADFAAAGGSMAKPSAARARLADVARPLQAEAFQKEGSGSNGGM